MATNEWQWTPYVAEFLFGFDPDIPKPSFSDWERANFIDDVPKLHAAVERAAQSGAYYSEFRVRHPDGSVHWIAGKEKTTAGRVTTAASVGCPASITRSPNARRSKPGCWRSTKLWKPVLPNFAKRRARWRCLNRTGAALAAELSLERLVQTVTDAAVELIRAQFGAFFYNVIDEHGEAYTLHSLSGAPREAFANFPMPRNTAVFEPTFRGEGSVRSDDILADPRYGHYPPSHGMPPGHLPVRSYLAIPVVFRSGEVIGGLFFGHSEPGIFTQRDERIVAGIAAQAAIAIDNAQLYEASQREVAARRHAEEELQRINKTLEDRVAEEVKERQQIEDALRQAQKMEAIGQLTGGIAHDFNNLLTVIVGNIETVQRRLPPDHETHRLIAAALRGAIRGAELLSVCSCSRGVSRSRLRWFHPTSWSPACPICCGAHSENCRDRNRLGGRALEHLCRCEPLENALINLAVNARDAMPDGGKLTIETANCYLDDAYCSMHADLSPGQYVGLFVTDAGSGMPEDVVEKAFSPFSRRKESARVPDWASPRSTGL